MQWNAEGVVLSSRRHGETSVIIEVFTREFGRCAGLVRGGTGRRLRPVLQPGNSVRRNGKLDFLSIWAFSLLKQRQRVLLGQWRILKLLLL